MKWISVKDRLPAPFESVWIYWRNREVLAGCRTYTGEEATRCPPEEGWCAFEEEKCRNCFWWMPMEKPEPPENP